MKILVIGGTKFFGIPMIKELIAQGHDITIATRGRVKDNFGKEVSRVILDRTDEKNIKEVLGGKSYDVIIDKIAYCSNDIKYTLDVVKCKKYINMSTVSVYKDFHLNIVEEEFNPEKKELIWCNGKDFSYDEIKRQAECALHQKYNNINAVSVRYPFVIGKDDYTQRLFFYIEHVIKDIPMWIDNIDCQMGYIDSEEAGKFLAFLVDKDYIGALNGCSDGTISIREILDYVENKTGKKAILEKTKEVAPYNGVPEYSVNTEKAKQLGFQFKNLKDWIYDLLDYYIELAIKSE